MAMNTSFLLENSPPANLAGGPDHCSPNESAQTDLIRPQLVTRSQAHNGRPYFLTLASQFTTTVMGGASASLPGVTEIRNFCPSLVMSYAHPVALVAELSARVSKSM